LAISNWQLAKSRSRTQAVKTQSSRNPSSQNPGSQKPTEEHRARCVGGNEFSKKSAATQAGGFFIGEQP
jgi:hypothetical protein